VTAAGNGAHDLGARDEVIALDRALARRLWARARALYDNEIAQERSYAARRYQIKTAVQAVLCALAGRNAAIELPTGTGKTLIACLVAVLWKDVRPHSRILLIVPSRTLVGQHFEVALWVARELVVDRLTDDQAGDPGSQRRTLTRGAFIVSTPGVLASAISRGVTDAAVVQSFDLVIVDEFDQFVVRDEGERETLARWAVHWQRLEAHLPKDARYLIKSATLGLGAAPPPKSGRRPRNPRADWIAERLDPVVIRVPERAYQAVAPFQRVRAAAVVDTRADQLLAAVSVSKGRAHLRLDEELGPVDYGDVERRAPQLCDGAVGRVVQLHGPDRRLRAVTMTGDIRRRFCAITSLMMMPQHIVEDLTQYLNVEYGPCAIKSATNEQIFLEVAPQLKDQRPDGRFRFQAGAKAAAVTAIVAARSAAGQRGVLFLRTITLLRGLAPLLATLGTPLFELTGELGDQARRQAVGGFRASQGGLLVMTRTTGGRGLDLPFADYALFYSPKSDPVAMWQEMSRIRATVSTPKDILVLCYGADELARLHKVVEALVAEGRRASWEIGQAERT
jgi:superfamily II DNA/RNA helicase